MNTTLTQQELDDIEKVKYNCFNIQYVNQTKAVCKVAVNIWGLILVHIKNPDDELCLDAVRQCGLALQFVKNKTLPICITAIKQCPKAILYVENQTHYLYDVLYILHLT